MRLASSYKVLLVALSLCTFSYSTLGQVTISVNSGIGTFTMPDLKRLQTELKMGFPVEVKEVETFPPYLIYELNISSFIDEHYSLGGTVGYKSTGSRLHYSDFSGSIGQDMLLSSITLGIIGNFYLQRSSRFDFSVFTNAGVDFSFLEIESDFELGGEQSSEEVEFTATNLFAEVGISNTVKFNRFFVNGSLGYEFTIADKLYWTENGDAYLTFSDGTEAQTQWNGLRLTLGIGVILDP